MCDCVKMLNCANCVGSPVFITFTYLQQEETQCSQVQAVFAIQYSLSCAVFHCE